MTGWLKKWKGFIVAFLLRRKFVLPFFILASFLATTQLKNYWESPRSKFLSNKVIAYYPDRSRFIDLNEKDFVKLYYSSEDIILDKITADMNENHPDYDKGLIFEAEKTGKPNTFFLKTTADQKMSQKYFRQIVDILNKQIDRHNAKIDDIETIDIEKNIDKVRQKLELVNSSQMILSEFNKIRKINSDPSATSNAKDFPFNPHRTINELESLVMGGIAQLKLAKVNPHLIDDYLERYWLIFGKKLKADAGFRFNVFCIKRDVKTTDPRYVKLCLQKMKEKVIVREKFYSLIGSIYNTLEKSSRRIVYHNAKKIRESSLYLISYGNQINPDAVQIDSYLRKWLVAERKILGLFAKKKISFSQPIAQYGSTLNVIDSDKIFLNMLTSSYAQFYRIHSDILKSLSKQQLTRQEFELLSPTGISTYVTMNNWYGSDKKQSILKDKQVIALNTIHAKFNKITNELSPVPFDFQPEEYKRLPYIFISENDPIIKTSTNRQIQISPQPLRLRHLIPAFAVLFALIVIFSEALYKMFSLYPLKTKKVFN